MEEKKKKTTFNYHFFRVHPLLLFTMPENKFSKTSFVFIAGRDRTNYLLVKEAKIIAMTCTHAALKRRDLVELGFKASNVYINRNKACNV